MEWYFTMCQTQSNNIASLFQFIIVVISIEILGACETTSEYDTSEALGSEVSAKASGRISERYSIFLIKAIIPNVFYQKKLLRRNHFMKPLHKGLF